VPNADELRVHTEARETLGTRISRWASKSLSSPPQPRGQVSWPTLPVFS
jgi:hypothetical protein